LKVAIIDAYGSGEVYEIDIEDIGEVNAEYIKKHGKVVCSFETNLAEETA